MLTEYWWIFPLAMALCFFMMAGRKGSMMCGPGSHGKNRQVGTTDSAIDILDKRFALGEIDKKEYEEAKRALKHSD